MSVVVGPVAAREDGDENRETYTVLQGDECFTITPFSHENKTVTEFYDYRIPVGENGGLDPDNPYYNTSGSSYSSEGPTDLQRANSSVLFLYENGGNLSLVFIHGAIEGPSEGGSATFTITGLPEEGEWAVKDDEYDNGTNYDNWTQEDQRDRIDWTWDANRTDGGAYENLGDEFTVTVEPAFNEDADLYGEHYDGTVDHWESLSHTDGDSEDHENTSLNLTEPVVISTKSCGDLKGVTATGDHGGDDEDDTDSKDDEGDKDDEVDEDSKDDERDEDRDDLDTGDRDDASDGGGDAGDGDDTGDTDSDDDDAGDGDKDAVDGDDSGDENGDAGDDDARDDDGTRDGDDAGDGDRDAGDDDGDSGVEDGDDDDKDGDEEDDMDDDEEDEQDGDRDNLDTGDGDAGGDSDQKKETICHRPPGNPGNAHTLSVGENAVDAHLAHGDIVGPCPDEVGDKDGDSEEGHQDGEGQQDPQGQRGGEGRQGDEPKGNQGKK